MSTATSRPPAPASAGSEGRVVLRGVDRDLYERLVASRGERPVPRLAWIGEDLELLSPSTGHEDLAELLGLLVRFALKTLGVPHRGLRSVTLARPDRARGKEADACFYVANVDRAPARRSKALDLGAHPPPDLAIEVEIGRPEVDIEAICAGLGVPELWRCDGERLRIRRLGDDGRYADREHSDAVPRLRAADVMPLIARADGLEDLDWMVAVERWARDDLARRRS